MADNRQDKHTAGNATSNVDNLRAEAQRARTAGDDQRAEQLEQQIREAEGK